MGEPQLYRERNGKTEKGYTAKMRKNILGKEREIRNNEDESLHVFSPSGDLLLSLQGDGAKVEVGDAKIPQNAILTHNHPRSIGTSGIRRIGNSLGIRDITAAVNYNAKEIRAVTPTYTFSIKRPKGGWGKTPQEVADVFYKHHLATQDEFRRYVEKRGYSDWAVSRAEVMHYHRVNQLATKELGWDYTKKNS